jgi:hypothetical protein
MQAPSGRGRDGGSPPWSCWWRCMRWCMWWYTYYASWVRASLGAPAPIAFVCVPNPNPAYEAHSFGATSHTHTPPNTSHTHHVRTYAVRHTLR